MTTFHDIAKGSGHLIKFLHVATGTRVEFPAFLTQFNDNYTVSWGNEQIFGRVDPIKPYQSTSRNISIGFDVLSDSLFRARENMEKYTTLVQMLYPVYGEPLSGGEQGRGRTLKAPPLIRLQFMNLIKNVSNSTVEEGLLGCISGVSMNPQAQSGYFTTNNELLPKNFNIQFTFEPQHETPLGFRGNNFINPEFPYGRSSSVTSDKVAPGTAEVSQARENGITGGNN